MSLLQPTTGKRKVPFQCAQGVSELGFGQIEEKMQVSVLTIIKKACKDEQQDTNLR